MEQRIQSDIKHQFHGDFNQLIPAKGGIQMEKDSQDKWITADRFQHNDGKISF